MKVVYASILLVLSTLCLPSQTNDEDVFVGFYKYWSSNFYPEAIEIQKNGDAYDIDLFMLREIERHRGYREGNEIVIPLSGSRNIRFKKNGVELRMYFVSKNGALAEDCEWSYFESIDQFPSEASIREYWQSMEPTLSN